MAESIQKLGDYLILERIAQGGMAQIYKAKTIDPNGIERLVVIKRILPHISADPEYVEMLIDEAKIAVHFTHGNIAQVYDLGKVGDDYFMVMEYVDGKTLGQIVREFREREKEIPLEIVVYCLIEICQGLDYMHRKTGPDGNPLGVVHRDISPQNIIVSYSGTVKIIDFGVAKAFEKLSHTESGVLKGKFAYMSPEQASGGPIDRRSDIFSAGTLFWELLTQQRLFKKSSNKETVKAVKKGEILPPSKIRIDVPREIDRIIFKALERKRERRYPSASDMAADLNRFLIDYKPDFRPLHVTQFLYRYFGPEADEADLPPEMPELALPKEPKPELPKELALAEEEETTVKESVSSSKRGWLKRAALALAGLVLLTAAGFASYWWGIRPFLWGQLLLEVEPPDASVFVDSALLPPAEKIYTLTRRAGKPFQLKIVREGFVPRESTVKLEGKKTTRLLLKLEKIIPPYGDLFVTSEPAGATLLVNGSPWNQKTPVKIAHLEQGKSYRITAVLDGYEKKEEEIAIQGGETKNLSFSLEIDYASVEIRSSPPGARVIIDGQSVGTTPYVNVRIKPGEVLEFSVEQEGFETVKDEVSLKAGETKTLSYELKEKI